MALTPVVLALSRSGEPVAARLAAALGAELHGRAGRTGAGASFPETTAHVRELFAAGVPVIGVCAAGILIRAVAPLLCDKREEPPVVAVAEDGSAVVPLLGGHRGANALATRIGAALGVSPALTTAGELALGLALDAPPPGWRLTGAEAAAGVMAGLLSGEPHVMRGQAEWLAPLARHPAVRQQPGPAGRVEIAPEAAGPGIGYAATDLVLGLGCARNADPAQMRGLVAATLAEAGLDRDALAGVATIELKADEPAVLAVATELGLSLRLFTAAELEAETGRLATPSEAVFAEVGCHGVAEGAALAAAGPLATLAATKRKSAACTCAIARAPAPLAQLAGRPRGHLAIVGIGPGQASWRSPEASRLVAAADEVVGYSLYLDLLGPLIAGKARADFPLGGEEERCRYALERAGEGRRVALVSSGDAGIYAMGALVFELLDRGCVSDAARRADVVTAPGISALQAAAARAGAPLGHDFCTISLSDLLTPREDILRRVEAAAAGDFVVAFYNPVSRTRRTLLAEARDLLLLHRPAETPVLLAANLGRPEERLVYRRLEALEVDEVDMLTVVIAGSSQSRLVSLGEGPRMYTPRGYAAKPDEPGDRRHG